MSICRNAEAVTILNMDVIEPVEAHRKWIYSNQRWKSITKHRTLQSIADLIAHPTKVSTVIVLIVLQS